MKTVVIKNDDRILTRKKKGLFFVQPHSTNIHITYNADKYEDVTFL